MGKEEIARNEQFLLFPTVSSTHSENLLPFSSNVCLSTLSVWKSLKLVVWERVKQLESIKYLADDKLKVAQLIIFFKKVWKTMSEKEKRTAQAGANKHRLFMFDFQ